MSMALLAYRLSPDNTHNISAESNSVLRHGVRQLILILEEGETFILLGRFAYLIEAL